MVATLGGLAAQPIFACKRSGELPGKIPAAMAPSNGPLIPIGENLYRVEADLPAMRIKRSMLVVRLDDGRLLIHSGIAMDDTRMGQLEAIGEPRIIVVPNGWHRMDAGWFKRRYPRASLICPRGVRDRVAKMVPVDDVYDAFDPGTPQLRLRHLEGVRPDEGVIEVESREGLTLVFNDLINNMPAGAGFFGYAVIAGSGRPGPHRMVTRLLAKDRKAYRSDLESLASRANLRRLVVSHGAVIDENPAGVLRDIAARL
jgi:hypothetical protein